MEQRRLAGAGFAGDEDVLRGAFAEEHVLQSASAGFADRHVDAGGAVLLPPVAVFRSDRGERHFDAEGLDGSLADLGVEPSRDILGGRRIDDQRILAELIVHPDIFAVAVDEGGAGFFQVFDPDAVGHRVACIDEEKRVDAATGARRGEADDALGRIGREVDGEVGHDQVAKRFGDFVGLFVVLGERLVLIAEKLLEDRLHRAGQIGEDAFDLLDFGPDAAVDEGHVAVAQVHGTGEMLAAPDRIDDGASRPARRQAEPDAQEQSFERLDAKLAALFVGLQKQRRFHRELEQRRHEQLVEIEARQLGRLGYQIRDIRLLDRHPAERQTERQIDDFGKMP